MVKKAPDTTIPWMWISILLLFILIAVVIHYYFISYPNQQKKETFNWNQRPPTLNVGYGYEKPVPLIDFRHFDTQKTKENKPSLLSRDQIMQIQKQKEYSREFGPSSR